jgi:hypothetical protein
MSSFRSEKAARKPYNVSPITNAAGTMCSTCFVANQRPAPRGDADGQWLHDKAPTGPRADHNGTGRPRNAGVPASAIAMNTRLAVSNLHYEITPKDLTVRLLPITALVLV